MTEIESVKNIKRFDEDTSIYIRKSLKEKLLRFHASDTKNIALLKGDILWSSGKNYTVITGLIKNIDDLDEKLSRSDLVVGSYCPESSLDQHFRKLPRAFREKEYFTILQYSEKQGKVKFITYKIEDDKLVQEDKKFTRIFESEILDEPINIRKELATFKESERLFSFVVLCIFSSLFGIFGGIIGFLSIKDQPVKRRVFILVVGILSTILWLAVSYQL